ncbi:hypothetical protein KUV80_13520 [Fictibacillus nanhaiensis]|uniref:DUF6449 domain-containing protein n=1 Tax=Fictibacillus nanhaiensis TaxID=742169 RepID=UPI001C979DCA|nr:DUF6449 domain-containing protein [Fictibacillus nanhaiensis]MBY6037684.1 hypothetical protein [Fictibacillus nanhaiensis]
MPSKTSWFNREIIKQSLRNTGWLGIVYFLGLVFAIPLRMLMNYTSVNEDYYQSPSNLFDYQLEIQVFLMFGIPILLAIFLFRYLHVKNAADFMHSLPIKRLNLYNHFVSMGVLILIVPIIMVSIILLILYSSLNTENYFTLIQLGEWVLITVVMTVFTFLATVFVGMITGISAIQGLFSFILLIFPLGISVLIAFNLSFLLHGFPGDYYLNKQFEKYSPFTIVDRLTNNTMESIEILIYFLLSILLYIFALQLYKLRKIEMVSQALGFPQLKPVFIYGTTFCMMLFGGVYFGETEHHFLWILFGYAIGSLIGFFVAQMIVEKTWRVFKNIRGFGIYAATTAIFFLLFQFDITGYESRLPEIEEIQSFYIGDNHYEYEAREDDLTFFVNKKKSYSDPENIQAVHDLHQQLISEKIPKNANEQIFILYELKDGSKQVREFKVASKQSYSSYLKPIYESMEYKEHNYPLLTVDGPDVDLIRFQPSGRISKMLTVSDPKEVSEIIEVIQADMQNQTFEDMTTERASLSFIEVSVHKKMVQLEFKPSYQKLKDLLKSKDMLKDAIVTGDDLRYAVIFKETKVERDPMTQEVDEQWVDEKIQQGDAIKVTEKDDLEKVLSNYSHGDKGEYTLALYYKNGSYTEVGHFTEPFVPEFVKQQLK